MNRLIVDTLDFVRASAGTPFWNAMPRSATSVCVAILSDEEADRDPAELREIAQAAVGEIETEREHYMRAVTSWYVLRNNELTEFEHYQLEHESGLWLGTNLAGRAKTQAGGWFCPIPATR